MAKCGVLLPEALDQPGGVAAAVDGEPLARAERGRGPHKALRLGRVPMRVGIGDGGLEPSLDLSQLRHGTRRATGPSPPRPAGRETTAGLRPTRAGWKRRR